MKQFIVLVVFSIVFTACSSDDDAIVEGDYLIFGHYSGMCVGESCVEIFKLTDTMLYEDVNDNYALDNLDFRELERATFDKVKDLKNFLPEQLLSSEEDIFGCPDCADGGGLYVQLSKNGVVSTWNIDQIKQNIPDYLHDFVDKINEKIVIINGNN